MNELEQFKKLFWDAFHRPKLESEKFLELWGSLEPENELLAGPLYAIYSNGNCDYLFKDQDRFPEINNVDDFLDFCTSHIHTYHDAVQAGEATNDVEKRDKQLLLYQTDTRME